MVPTSAPLHLAVALDGAGWHPAAWREPDAQPQRLFTAGYWTELAQQAERGLLDFLTIEDGLDLQSDDRFEADARTDRVRGRLDAVLIAARAAPATRNIGFVPTAITTHTEPFHLSKAIATLDYVSGGRAGIRVRIEARARTAAHFGRREIPPLRPDRRDDPEVRRLIEDHFDEAADYVEVLRRLWDSWDDDAEIRDVATGRFIDRDKLHYIDFEGRWFSVRGPSITPRPPQGQPVVAALGHASVPYQLIARSADVGFVTPRDAAHAAGIVAEIRAAGPASTGLASTAQAGTAQASTAQASAGQAAQPEYPAPSAPVPSAPTAPGTSSRPALVPSSLRGTTERMSRPRQVIAKRMVESLQVSAQLTTVVEADVTNIARLRDRAKAAFEAREGVKLTFLPFFAQAAVEALKVHPKLNAVINSEAQEVTYHDAEHLGIAVDTERGLMVPVVHQAGDLNLGGLARKIADVAARTRSGQVSPDELSGGTFTLTNTGSRGALFDTPIINQPQVGILGVGTVVKRAVVVEDPSLGEVIAVRSMVYLALTYDHRLVDGADAARFLVTVKGRLEEGAFEAELGL